MYIMLYHPFFSPLLCRVVEEIDQKRYFSHVPCCVPSSMPVGPPLWKIWVRQLGWWMPQYSWENAKFMAVPKHQPGIYWKRNQLGRDSFNHVASPRVESIARYLEFMEEPSYHYLVHTLEPLFITFVSHWEPRFPSLLGCPHGDVYIDLGPSGLPMGVYSHSWMVDFMENIPWKIHDFWTPNGKSTIFGHLKIPFSTHGPWMKMGKNPMTKRKLHVWMSDWISVRLFFVSEKDGKKQHVFAESQYLRTLMINQYCNTGKMLQYNFLLTPKTSKNLHVRWDYFKWTEWTAWSQKLICSFHMARTAISEDGLPNPKLRIRPGLHPVWVHPVAVQDAAKMTL